MNKFYLVLLLSISTTLSLLAQSDQNGDLQAAFPSSHTPLNFNTIEGELTTIPAGDLIEGDYIGEMKFTPDGNEVWVLHRSTNNISVIDWESKAIIKNIEVGLQPMDIDFSDSLAIIPCMLSDRAYVIRLSDYRIIRILPTARTPVKVDISKNGNIAAIGCTEPAIAEIYDLNTFNKIQTIPNFPVEVSVRSFITSNPRQSVYYSNFRITDDENYLINGRSTDGLKFYEISSGQVSATLSEVKEVYQIELSGDGKTLATSNIGTPGIAYQIDVERQTLIKQIELINDHFSGTYSPPAVDADGSHLLVASFAGNTTLIDFNTESFQHVATGNTPDWVGRTNDASLFVASDFFTAIINPEDGAILSSLDGNSIQSGAVGKGKRIAATDPLRYESIRYYDFSTNDILVEDSISTTGSLLEADATYFVKFTPDEKKVIAVNSLSGSLSIINTSTDMVEAIIPLQTHEIFQVDITSDSRYALIAKRISNSVVIIDLSSYEIIAEIPTTGSKPDQVFVLPGDQYAYVINSGGVDFISVIELNGANSNLLSTIPIGNTGVNWTNYGIRSDLKFTADGKYGLISAPFSDKVQIIRLADHTIIDEIELAGFPLQIVIADNGNNEYFAGVTLRNRSQLVILNGQGDDWDLVGNYQCINSVVRIDFDPIENAIWIVSTSSGAAQKFSLNSFSFENYIDYLDTSLRPLAIRFSEGGQGFTLLQSQDLNESPHQLKISTATDSASFDFFSLPIHHFDITKDGRLAAIAHPATDEVSLFKQTPVGIQQVNINLNKKEFQVFPNPANEEVNFKSLSKEVRLGKTILRVWNAKGEVIDEAVIIDANEFQVSRNPKWLDGIYFYEIYNDKHKIQSGRIVFQ